MDDLTLYALAAFLALTAPFAVGFLMGVDRKLTARMQNRVGPPLVQPFYDLFKLLGKERRLINPSQAYFALGYLLLEGTSLVVLAAQGDLLVVFFLSGAGSLFLVLGAFSARSPFSQMGAQRELLQILAYEPVFFLIIVSIGIQEHSFISRDMSQNLIVTLPLSLIALVAVLVIKLQKSPYDIAHAHTELVSGPLVEYSGPYLATVELARWAEIAVVFGILTLFWNDPEPVAALLGKMVLVFAALFTTLVIDNVTARLTRRRMVTFTLSFGIALVAANIIWNLYLGQGVGI